MSRKRILTIDDEPDMLDFLGLVLERSGYESLTAANGTEGLIRANVEQPDLILLDIMLEEMNGWEILEVLQQDARTSQIPVVVLSARSAPQDRRRALGSGAVDFLAKPFVLREVLDKIEAILER